MSVSPTFTVRYLNVGGKHVLHVPPEWLDADIICLAETHHPAGAPAWMTLAGFHTHECNRAPGQHGGICVMLRSDSPWFQAGVHVQGCVQKGVVWVHAKHSNLSVALCYFSPASSVLYRDGVLHPSPELSLLESVSAMHAKGRVCVVVGDMNARVGTLASDMPDLTAPLKHGPAALQYAMHVDQESYQGIPGQRSSADTQESALGRQLMLGLQAVHMVVLNGRAPGDEQGSFTYLQPPAAGDGRSVVDLACVSAVGYRYVQQMCVLPHDPDLSPDHCPVRLALQLPLPGHRMPARKLPRVHRLERPEAVQYYRRLLSAVESRGLFQDTQHRFDSGQLSAAQALQEVADVVRVCCAVAGRAQGPTPGVLGPGGTPWFDAECRASKDVFMAAQAALQQAETAAGSALPAEHQLRQSMLAARHAWQRLKRSKERRYKQQYRQDMLETFFSRSQRDVWKQLQGPRVSGSGVTAAAFTEHCRMLYGQVPEPLTLTQEQQHIKQQHREQFRRDGGDAAEGLNAPMHGVELVAAMGKLKAHKALDADGLSCDLLRYVVKSSPGAAVVAGSQAVPDVPPGVVSPGLVACLTAVLDKLPACAEYPNAMAVGRLVPVPKQSGPAVEATHNRGICVSGVFAQLYDAVLHARAETYFEEQELRAVVQCGFRRRHGTLDALFTLQHLISRYKYEKRLLYVCFVDFQKAFDVVRREEMLSRAQQLGVHGKFLAALAQWFDNSMLCVHAGWRKGQPFQTYRGTKQGSRLSPLMFGLFVEQLHELIGMQVPGAGPLIEGMHVPDIMYADDVKIMAESATQLQQLLDVLHLFCQLFDMRVNVSPDKTCVVVYGAAALRSGQPAYEWRVGDQVVPVSDAYRDLGVDTHAVSGMRQAHVRLAAAGRKAMHAVLAICRQHHIVQPDFKLRLYNAMVDPALLYACQVWGPWLFHSRNGLQVEAAQHVLADKVCCDYLRIMAGVGKRVNKQLLLLDFGRLPLAWRWVALATRMWCKLVSDLHADKLSARALRDDVRLMLRGCTDCWVYKWLDTLSSLGVVDKEDWKPTRESCPTVSAVLNLAVTEKTVKEVLQSRFVQVLADAQAGINLPHMADTMPRQAAEEHVMVQTYVSWVRARNLELVPRHLKCRQLSFEQVQVICRIRLGWHRLEIQKGRFHTPSIPRQQRVCKLCAALGFVDSEGSVPVEDVLHFLVECRALEPVRGEAQFAPVFMPISITDSSAATLARYILNHKDQVLMARALQALWMRREQCHEHLQAGGLNMHGYLPVDPTLRRIQAADAYYEEWLEVPEGEVMPAIWY